MKRVLILGGAGFIGQHLAFAMQNDYQITLYDREKRNDQFSFIEGDFVEEKDFDAILQSNQINIIFHLISTTIPKEDTSDIVEEIQQNIIPTLRLLEAMRKQKDIRLIFVSSGGTVYGESKGEAHQTSDKCTPICGYGMQKIIIEQYMEFYRRRYKLDCRIARLANPYGVPPQRPRGQGIVPIFLERLICGEPIALYGDTFRDYIHIDDAVKALISMTEYEGDQYCFNIGTGVGIRLSDMVRKIEEITGKQFSEIRHFPIRQCDVMESILNIEETEKELLWHPGISLEDGIKRTWESIHAYHSVIK